MANQDTLDLVLDAARYGELDEIQKINASPTVYAQGNDLGTTALHMAAANGHSDIVAWIINAWNSSSDINAQTLINTQNHQGNTPLHWAALNGHEEVVRFLVDHGANPQITNNSGKSPVFEAESRDHEKIVEYLAEFVEPANDDEEGAGNEHEQPSN